MPFDYSQFTQDPKQAQSANAQSYKQEFDYSKFSNQEQQSQAQAGQAPSSPPGMENTQGLSFVAGFMDSVSKLRTGILKALTPEGGSTEQALDQSRDFYKGVSGLASQINPKSTSLGKFVGEAAPAGLLAAVAPQSIPGQVAYYTGTGAALGALENPEDGKTRTMGGVVGGLSGLAGGLAGGTIQGITKNLPTRQISELASKGELDDKVVKAAKNLGVEISPFEASSSLSLQKALQDKTIMTPDRLQELHGFIENRNQKLLGSFNDIMESVAPKGSASEIYHALNPRQIAPEKLSNILPQEGKPLGYLQNLYQEAHNSRMNFEGVTPGSFEDLHKVKKYIGGLLKTDTTAMSAAAKQGISSSAKGAEAADLKAAKAKIQDALMSVSSKEELPVATEMAKKGGFIKNITAKIEAIATKGKGLTPEQLHTAVAGTPAKEKYFLNTIAARGGDVQKAKDFLDVMGKIKDSPLPKLLGKNMKGGDYGISPKDVGVAGMTAYVTNPQIATGSFLGSLLLRAGGSKAYYKQIFKDLPVQKELSQVPGQVAGGAGLVGAQ